MGVSEGITVAVNYTGALMGLIFVIMVIVGASQANWDEQSLKIMVVNNHNRPSTNLSHRRVGVQNQKHRVQVSVWPQIY